MAHFTSSFEDLQFYVEFYHCLYLHSQPINDRAAKGMHDPDWLEVVGNPTIPHVQSLRQPPAQVALPVSNEKLIGLTNKNASRRYLQKLQKDRERNHEVLTECVDNLPIVIRQMAYPESPGHKTTAGSGNGSVVHSAEKKFRIGRLRDELWQENAEQWIKEEHDKEKSPRISRQTGSSDNGDLDGRTADDSQCKDSEYVHHAGFVGNQNQTSALKYRFGKKKAKLTSENADAQSKSTFRPKGFGTLYDEMEFERRYKKVFDLNKHIHFVHSNFLSGQRIVKRTKLPPIGHNPSVFSDQSDGGDIFAIMSVQRYNYPDDFDPPNSLFTQSSNSRHKSDGSPRRRHMKRSVEIPREVEIPIGFVPGTIPKSGFSPFDGVKGVINMDSAENQYRLPSWMRESDSGVGNDHHEEVCRSERSMRHSSNRAKSHDDSKTKTVKKKHAMKQKHEKTLEPKSDDESEPFNISVHVELKPKDTYVSGGDDENRCKEIHDSPRRDNHKREKDHSPRMEQKPRRLQNKKHHTSAGETVKENIMCPRILSRETDSESGASDNDQNEHVLRPKHSSTTTNQYGTASQKVTYPEHFVLSQSLAEEDEPLSDNDDTSVKVPKLFADSIPQQEPPLKLSEQHSADHVSAFGS